MMDIYARLDADVIAEVIEPLVVDGQQVPIAERFHPSFVDALINITDMDPAPQEGWITSDGGVSFGAPPPVAATPPQTVTAAQGGIALIQLGKMDAVLQIANAEDTPAEVKWAWERAQVWERSSPALTYLAERAGITTAEMDEYFSMAALVAA